MQLATYCSQREGTPRLSNSQAFLLHPRARRAFGRQCEQQRRRIVWASISVVEEWHGSSDLKFRHRSCYLQQASLLV